MTRVLCCVAAVLSAAGLVRADDPPKGGGHLVTQYVTVEGDTVVNVTTSRQVKKMELSGRGGGEPKVVDVVVEFPYTRTRHLKDLRVTGPDDKDIPPAEFKERFKDGGWVVLLEVPLDPGWKAKFRKDAVFVEYGIPVKDKPADKKPDGK